MSVNYLNPPRGTIARSIAPVVGGRLPPTPQSTHTISTPEDVRKTTGLVGLDEVMGDLSPGHFVCLAGRPCMGKTLLLLDIAARILRRHRTNVVYGTVGPLLAKIKPAMPVAVRANSVIEIAPDIGLLERRLATAVKPQIYMTDIHSVGAEWANLLAHRLQIEHKAGCGVLILDGWTVYRDLVTQAQLQVNGIPYRLNVDRRDTTLSAAELIAAKDFCLRSQIPTIYSIRTRENTRQIYGPTLDDLRHLAPACRSQEFRTVFVHRPSVYLRSGTTRISQHTLVRLTAAVLPAERRRESLVRYDTSERTFFSL